MTDRYGIPDRYGRHIEVGDRVEGGKLGTEDHDIGRILSTDSPRVLVAWDSHVTTWCEASELTLRLCAASGRWLHE